MKVSKQGKDPIELVKKLIKHLDDKKVSKVGWVEKKVYPEKLSNKKDSKKKSSTIEVAKVASIQEFGSPKRKIPPRSYFRSTIEKRKNAWEKILGKELIASVTEEKSTDHALEKIGLLARGDIGKAITQLSQPALKKATIDARLRRGKTGKKRLSKLAAMGAVKPLVDTELMLSTLTYLVDRE